LSSSGRSGNGGHNAEKRRERHGQPSERAQPYRYAGATEACREVGTIHHGAGWHVATELGHRCDANRCRLVSCAPRPSDLAMN